MSTHLYCILPHADRDDVPQGLSGVDGARVRALPVDHVVAWVSDVERSKPVSYEVIRAHDAVVEAALATGATPMPARFGQTFSDDTACRSALSRRASSVESVLEGLQGCVEMTVIITPSTKRMLSDLEPVVPQMFQADAPGAGRGYLQALRAREAATGDVERASSELADRLEAAAADVLQKTARPRSEMRMPMLTLSHLVRRSDVDRYRAAISEVKTGPELRFLLIGPRAPYSFCALDTGRGGAHGMNLAD